MREPKMAGMMLGRTKCNRRARNQAFPVTVANSAFGVALLSGSRVVIFMAIAVTGGRFRVKPEGHALGTSIVSGP